jgi:hypothetical protein
MNRAAIGLRPHTGWAALVAVGGAPASPIVLDRRRLELIDDMAARHVYHAARELELPAAEKLVRRAARTACAAADRALGDVAAGLQGSEYTIAAAGIVAQARRLPPLARIVASHALVHSAEGELYRAALADAAEAVGLDVHLVAAPDVFETAADALGVDGSRLAAQIAAIGRELGPPWRKDQKEATAVALVALASSRAAER